MKLSSSRKSENNKNMKKRKFQRKVKRYVVNEASKTTEVYFRRNSQVKKIFQATSFYLASNSNCSHNTNDD